MSLVIGFLFHLAVMYQSRRRRWLILLIHLFGIESGVCVVPWMTLSHPSIQTRWVDSGSRMYWRHEQPLSGDLFGCWTVEIGSRILGLCQDGRSTNLRTMWAKRFLRLSRFIQPGLVFQSLVNPTEKIEENAHVALAHYTSHRSVRWVFCLRIEARPSTVAIGPICLCEVPIYV